MLAAGEDKSEEAAPLSTAMRMSANPIACAGWMIAIVADSAREAMDLVYRQGGSTSYRRESRLAECWRDLHVVGQAVTLAPEWYPIGGRVYLNMDPGPRLR